MAGSARGNSSRTPLFVLCAVVVALAGCIPVAPVQHSPPVEQTSNTGGAAILIPGDFQDPILSSRFAPAWDPFHNNRQIMTLSPSEPVVGGSAQLDIGFLSGTTVQFTYYELHVLKAGTSSWKKYVLPGNQAVPGFLNGSLNLTIPSGDLALGDNFVAAYFCTDIVRNASGSYVYACGCADNTLTNCGKWSIERITVKAAQTCGNSLIEGSEVCDGTDLASKTCQTVGNYTGGTLGCEPDCSGFNTTACTTPPPPATCPNGQIDTGEVCDGTNFGGTTCPSLGFRGGTLTCTNCLVIDNTSCTAVTAPLLTLGTPTTTGTAAAIAWTTDIPSDSWLEWGTSQSYGTSTTVNATKTTQHSVTLSGLLSNSLYYFRAHSKDAAYPAYDGMASGSFTTQNVCGNGLVDPGESCDPTAANSACCTQQCQYNSSGTVCRAAPGSCDVAETCTGASAACPANAFKPVTSICRAAAGTCDVAESCPGTSAGCPTDAFLPSTTACGPVPTQTCEQRAFCSGSAATCPTNPFNSSATMCRASTQACDPADFCSGTSYSCPSVNNCDTQPPTAPIGLTAQAASASQINLAWQPGTDNVGIQTYRISRSTSATSGFAVVASTAANSYTNTGLAAGTTYYYYLTTVDTSNLASPTTMVVSAQTAAACVPQCTGKCGGAADGCGGTCTASCSAGQVCTAQTCCTPNPSACSGKCGSVPDGCGGQAACGGCGSGLSCVANVCTDTTPPQAQSVTASGSNRPYGSTEQITITVTYSEPVVVTGIPQLLLETGTLDRAASYTGTNGNSVSFLYTVQPGDTSNDLDYQSTNAIQLNGGTIRDAAGNNAVNTLPSPGAAGSLGASKNIVVDTTPPTVSITGPAAGSTVSAPVAISASVSDQTAISSVVFDVNGFTGSDTMAPYQVIWDPATNSITTFATSGGGGGGGGSPTKQTLIVTATDAAGNSGSATEVFWLDNLA